MFQLKYISTENLFQLKICFNRHHHNASFSQGAIIGETTQAPADGKETKSGQQINFLDSLKRYISIRCFKDRVDYLIHGVIAIVTGQLFPSCQSSDLGLCLQSF